MKAAERITKSNIRTKSKIENHCFRGIWKNWIAKTWKPVEELNCPAPSSHPLPLLTGQVKNARKNNFTIFYQRMIIFSLLIKCRNIWEIIFDNEMKSSFWNLYFCLFLNKLSWNFIDFLFLPINSYLTVKQKYSFLAVFWFVTNACSKHFFISLCSVIIHQLIHVQ